jgi:hypothetical protein
MEGRLCDEHGLVIGAGCVGGYAEEYVKWGGSSDSVEW